MGSTGAVQRRVRQKRRQKVVREAKKVSEVQFYCLWLECRDGNSLTFQKGVVQGKTRRKRMK